MGEYLIAPDTASIEDYWGGLKVDFANKYIGGGALIGGNVQEEIMFANHPELFATQLLCEVMAPNESLIFMGFRKYFNNIGYGSSVKYYGFEKYQYDYAGKMAK